MTSGFSTIIYPARDLAQAKAFYAELLGIAPYVDQPYYVGFRVGGQEIGLDPQGHDKGMVGPLCYWAVDDIEAGLQRLLDAGAQVQQAIKDVGGGRRIAWVKDAEGNVTGLMQSG